MTHQKMIISIVCLIAVFAILTGTIWDFSHQLQYALTKETYRTLSEVSIDYNKAFLDRISSIIKTLNVLAGSLGTIPQQTNQDTMRILQNAVTDGGFTEIVVCDTNGSSYSHDGTFANVSHRDYFQQALQGKTNVSEPLTSLVTGKETIVIAVPIPSQNSPSGVLLGVYPLDTAGAQLLDFTYYSTGYNFIVTPDGGIVLSSERADKLFTEKNIISFFEKTNLLDYSMTELKTAITNGQSKNFSFLYNGERRFVSFVPSGINDWYTFSIAPDTLMRQQENATNQIVLRLIVKLIILGLLLLTWIIISNRHHNKALLLANQKYQSLLDNINGGMIVATHAQNADAIIATYVSCGFTKMTGYTLQDIHDIYQGRYLELLLDEDRKDAFEKHWQQITIGNTYHVSYRIRKKDKSIIWVMDNGYLIKNADGLHNHSILTDITLIKQREEELRSSENRFSVAINASSGTLFEVDLEKKLYTHFENAERIFGVSAEKLFADTRAFSSLSYTEFIDAVTAYFFHPDDCQLTQNAMAEAKTNGMASYEARIRRFDNSYIWARIDLSFVLNEFGEPWRLVGYISDIDEIKKHAELLENKVQTDPMTGLYNKVAMATLTNKVLQEYPRQQHALIVLDIDNFKGINDTLGHAFGDVVLIEVATKLKAIFRNTDIVGRMGGDEFAILMKDIMGTHHVFKKAAEISSAFRQTYTGQKGDYKVSCSMGIIVNENNCNAFETLYQKADAALYQAKQNGKDQFVLYQEQDAASYPIESTRSNDEEVQTLNTHHDTKAYVFELLYASKDFDISINMALAIIGQQYHVSRVSVFENNTDNQTTSNIYEWCNKGIPSEMANIKNMKISSGTESLLSCFDQNGLLYCNDIRELAPYPQQLLKKQGVLSTLKVTIVNDGKIYGFIGFDECTEYRIWTSEEIEQLSFMAKVLSIFLFKKKTEITLMENLNTRLEILDVLPDYICVVNPQTHLLVYANSKMQELLPSAQSGAFCFQTLRGEQTAPCQTCIIERIKHGDTNNLEIVNKNENLRLPINALAINWFNGKEMVLLYGVEKAQ